MIQRVVAESKEIWRRNLRPSPQKVVIDVSLQYNNYMLTRNTQGILSRQWKTDGGYQYRNNAWATKTQI